MTDLQRTPTSSSHGAATLTRIADPSQPRKYDASSFNSYNKVAMDELSFVPHYSPRIAIEPYKPRPVSDRFFTILYLVCVALTVIVSLVIYCIIYLRVIKGHELTFHQTAAQITVRIVPDLLLITLPFLIQKCADYVVANGSYRFFVITNLMYTMPFIGLLVLTVLKKKYICIGLVCAAIIVQLLALPTLSKRGDQTARILRLLDAVAKQLKGLQIFVYCTLAAYIVLRLVLERIFFFSILQMGTTLFGSDSSGMIRFVTIFQIAEFIMLNWTIMLILGVQKAVVSGAVLSYFNGAADKSDSSIMDSSDVNNGQHLMTWYAKVAFTKSFGSISLLSVFSILFEMISDFFNIMCPVLHIEMRIPLLCNVLDGIRFIALKLLEFYTSFNLVRCIAFGESVLEARRTVRETLTRKSGKQVLIFNLTLGHILHRAFIYVIIIFAIPFLILLCIALFFGNGINFLHKIGLESVFLPILLNTLAIGCIIATPLKAVWEATVTCLILNPEPVMEMHPQLANELIDIYNLPLEKKQPV